MGAPDTHAREHPGGAGPSLWSMAVASMALSVTRSSPSVAIGANSVDFPAELRCFWNLRKTTEWRKVVDEMIVGDKISSFRSEG